MANLFFYKKWVLELGKVHIYTVKPENPQKRVLQVNQSQIKEKFPELQEKVKKTNIKSLDLGFFLMYAPAIGS